MNFLKLDFQIPDLRLDIILLEPEDLMKTAGHFNIAIAEAESKTQAAEVELAQAGGTPGGSSEHL